MLAFQGGGGPGSAQPRLGELAAAGGQGLAEAGPVDAGDGLEGGQRVLQPAQRAVPGRRRFGHRVSCGAGGGGCGAQQRGGQVPHGAGDGVRPTRTGWTWW